MLVLDFVKKHWLTLALLAGSVFAVNWIVSNKRAPGSMTVIEAQGMDMTTMKAPTGAVPVAVEEAMMRPLVGGKSFPATVIPFTDEDVVARVPGKIAKVLVYPGDRVMPGQLVAVIDAPEYEAELRQKQAMSSAQAAKVVSASQMIAHHEDIEAKAKATVKASQAALSRAQTDVDTADLELQKARDDLAGKETEIDQMRSDLRYADQDLARMKELYKEGAIALDRLQVSQKNRDVASAKVDGAVAAMKAAQKSVTIAEKKLIAAKQMVEESRANLDSAKAEADQAREAILQAHADERASKFESSAANADVSGAATIADYRELRAMSGGIVSERVISPGTPVMAGQAVIKIKDLGSVRIQADIPQAMSTSVREGATIQVVGDSFTRQATLTSVFPTVNPDTRTFRVEAILKNDHNALKSGMFVRIELGGSPSPGQLTVRSSAVHTDDSGKYVWVVQHREGTGKVDWTCTMHPQISKSGPGKCPICSMDLVEREKGGEMAAHRQPVTTSGSAGDFTAIASGLKAGDKVIWAGFENLIEGSPVQPTNWGPDGPSENPPAENQTMPDMPGMDNPAPKEQEQPPVKTSAKQESATSEISKPKTEPKKKTKPPMVADDYTCPMHLEVHSDKPGECPKCGMDLVKRKEIK